MKTSIIFLIVISIFFQSCFSYRAIDLKTAQLKIQKEYKIRQDAKFVKVSLEKVNDSNLTVLEGNTRKYIPISSIKEIKEEKFSILKSTGMAIVVSSVILLGVAAIFVPDISLGDFNMEDK